MGRSSTSPASPGRVIRRFSPAHGAAITTSSIRPTTCASGARRSRCRGLIFDSERFLNPEVETLYEAFKRVFGDGAITASIHEPQGRGADHAVFETAHRRRQDAPQESSPEDVDEISPRWMADKKPAMHREEIVDIRGMAQLIALFEHCGDAHADFRRARIRADRRRRARLRPASRGAARGDRTHRRAHRQDASTLLRARGMLDSTLFVVTSDHGMAAQRHRAQRESIVEPQKRRTSRACSRSR